MTADNWIAIAGLFISQALPLILLRMHVTNKADIAAAQQLASTALNAIQANSNRITAVENHPALNTPTQEKTP